RRGRSWVVQLYVRLLIGRFQVRILVAEPLNSKSALFRPTGFVEPRESSLGMILPRSSLHGVGVGAGLTGGRRKRPQLALIDDDSVAGVLQDCLPRVLRG